MTQSQFHPLPSRSIILRVSGYLIPNLIILHRQNVLPAQTKIVKPPSPPENLTPRLSTVQLEQLQAGLYKMALQAISFEDNRLHILDQLQLPFVTSYRELKTAQDAWDAIKEMQVRGAPAIAIVAALALAAEIHEIRSNAKLSTIPQRVASFVEDKLDYLVTSRPTAVNLTDAARKLKLAVKKEGEREGATGESVAITYELAAAKMLVDDLNDNKQIGDFGAEWIIKNAYSRNGEKGVAILTHCNTG
jgi:methylthioribose-1-phosphate isomerase